MNKEKENKENKSSEENNVDKSSEKKFISVEDKLKEQIQILENDKNDLKNKNISLLAEMENLRKNVKVEKQDTIKYFSIKLFYDLIPSIEMFENALKVKNVSDEVKNWLLGFNMIYKNMMETLERQGVKKINTNINDDFDYNIHESIGEEFSDSVEKGKILSIKNNGYLLQDRLIRPSVVILSKGKEEKEEKEKDIQEKKI